MKNETPDPNARFAARNFHCRTVLGTALACLLMAGSLEAGQNTKRQRQAAKRAPAAQEQLSAAQLAGPKRTVSVSKFSLKSDFQHLYGNTDIGGGLAAMLTTALVASNHFIVVERPDLGVALAEQQLTASGIVRQEGQAEVGELLGAQLILAGHVTEFSERAKGGGFSIGLSAGGSRSLGLSPQKRVGTVGIDVRVIDSTTGQVIASYFVREEVKARSLAASVNLDGVNLARTKTQQTPLGEAARKAIDQVVYRFAAEAARQEWQGRVVDVEAGEVAINAGRLAGVKTGDSFSVYRIARVLTDPSTGRVLGHRKIEVGGLTVTAVEENFAFAHLASASGYEAERGDLVLSR